MSDLPFNNAVFKRGRVGLRLQVAIERAFDVVVPPRGSALEEQERASPKGDERHQGTKAAQIRRVGIKPDKVSLALGVGLELTKGVASPSNGNGQSCPFPGGLQKDDCGQAFFGPRNDVARNQRGKVIGHG